MREYKNHEITRTNNNAHYYFSHVLAAVAAGAALSPEFLPGSPATPPLLIGPGSLRLLTYERCPTGSARPPACEGGTLRGKRRVSELAAACVGTPSPCAPAGTVCGPLYIARLPFAVPRGGVDRGGRPSPAPYTPLWGSGGPCWPVMPQAGPPCTGALVPGVGGSTSAVVLGA